MTIFQACSGGKGARKPAGKGQRCEVFEDYDIGKVLGKGGFGEVRLCRSKETDETYAVKIIDLTTPLAQAEETGESITQEDEAIMMKELKHKYIISVEDYYRSDRFLYVVMESAAGGEVFQVIANPAIPIKEKDFQKVIKELLTALSYLHGKMIVHRDVKAENLLLTEKPTANGIGGDVKLIDFGLAARLDGWYWLSREDDLNQLDTACGTPPYCAPEIWTSGMPGIPPQWKEDFGETYGPKVDVYATGVMLYLAAHGSFPYGGNSVQDFITSACSHAAVPPYRPQMGHAVQSAGGNYQISKECRDFMEQCMEKFPEDRLTVKGALKHDWLVKTTTRKLQADVPVGIRQSAEQEMNRFRRGAGLQKELEREQAFLLEAGLPAAA